MSNDQLTINILRELNSRLASEITELRKENAEIPILRKNFSEVEAENNKLKAENVKLKQALEEHESRFVKLEQNDKDTAVENAELKARVAKLEQKQSQIDEKNNFIVKSDDYAKGINQSSVDITSTEMENSNDTHEQIDLQCDDTPASDISDNASNSDELNNAPNSDVSDNAFSELSENVCQETKTQCSTSPICIETKSFDDKKIEFLDRVHKEQISNEIRERNRKKKLQSQGSIQNTSSSSDIQNEVNPVIDQARNTGIKIPYNKRVEQDLRHDLSVFIKENNNKINNVFDIQIPEFSLEVIITRSTKVTAQNIADLFILAIKVKQKEILCWYCYYKAYEDRIDEIKHINKIDDQSARTLVYNEIKALLPDTSDVNLRQKTFRAKKIYTLLVGIGVEKVQAITCSASAISSLTDNQIQDIINCFSGTLVPSFHEKNSNADVFSAKCQKMIGVTNCNAHVTERSNLIAGSPKNGTIYI
ncbi:hypothetical protein Glove_158g77 [Diversispora epigaea]|uniref:Uncharacterized protein n=1 Tax=Diversispora epigaea TaxID=1348612 RepID=A0A397IRR7_9GLOM|nr:hypothetical protein Glove_158g77 [Diversispora epigaea]